MAIRARFTCFALALLSAPAAAQLPFVETFTDKSNVGGWEVAKKVSFPPNFGNPGWFLLSFVDAPGPLIFSKDEASPFGGDWRAKGVRSVGLDLRTFIPHPHVDRELSLMLVDDGGTPRDFLDDCIVAFVGAQLTPQYEEGWRSFDFFVDADSSTLPPGWKLVSESSGCHDPDAAWNRIITHVARVEFYYGDPQMVSIFWFWQVGIDNVRISNELPASTYCAAKRSSQGCMALLSLSGTPSSTSPTPFVVQAGGASNHVPGVLIYGFAPWNVPFQGGKLCVAGPLHRTPGIGSGGSISGSDCTGSFSFDFNAWIQGGSDPQLQVGQEVFAQYWYRDLVSSRGMNLTDGVQFTIQP